VKKAPAAIYRGAQKRIGPTTEGPKTI